MHHVGSFAELEDQMCNFTTDFDRKAAGYSPDRVDALVWAATDLLIEQMKGYGIFELYTRMAAARIAPHRQPVIADAPDPRQTRIIAERQRFAALGVSRTAEEAADHVAAIDRIIRGGA
jgi:hypothetical protein